MLNGVPFAANSSALQRQRELLGLYSEKIPNCDESPKSPPDAPLRWHIRNSNIIASSIFPIHCDSNIWRWFTNIRSWRHYDCYANLRRWCKNLWSQRNLNRHTDLRGRFPNLWTKWNYNYHPNIWRWCENLRSKWDVNRYANLWRRLQSKWSRWNYDYHPNVWRRLPSEHTMNAQGFWSNDRRGCS